MPIVIKRTTRPLQPNMPPKAPVAPQEEGTASATTKKTSNEADVINK